VAIAFLFRRNTWLLVCVRGDSQEAFFPFGGQGVFFPFGGTKLRAPHAVRCTTCSQGNHTQSGAPHAFRGTTLSQMHHMRSGESDPVRCTTCSRGTTRSQVHHMHSGAKQAGRATPATMMLSGTTESGVPCNQGHQMQSQVLFKKVFMQSGTLMY
jgi:hypothetical protein